MNLKGTSPAVETILARYSDQSPAVVGQIRRVLNTGVLAGTGNTVFYPVDQMLEHGHARLYWQNMSAADPLLNAALAVEAGMSAIAMPPGSSALIARQFAGIIPMVMKINSRSSLSAPGPFTQAVLGTVEEAVALGCSGVGYTIYPGSSEADNMMEEFALIRAEANAAGLFTVLWVYPRGEAMDKWKRAKDDKLGAVDPTVAIDVTADGVRLGCELRADFVKVKFPNFGVANPDAQVQAYYKECDFKTQTDLAKHISHAAMGGNRLVLFSGGEMKGTDEASRKAGAQEFYAMAEAIRDGGCCGSICGRNVTQRSYIEAVAFLKGLMEVYKEKKPASVTSGE